MKCFYSAIRRYLEIFYQYRGRLKGLNALLNCYGMCLAINILIFKESQNLQKVNLFNRLYKNCIKHRIYSSDFQKDNEKYFRSLSQLFLLAEGELNYIIGTSKKIEEKLEGDVDAGFISGKWRPGLLGVEVLDLE